MVGLMRLMIGRGAGENVTLNKYLYGNGNPVSFVDPSGYYTQQEGYAIEAKIEELYREDHDGNDVEFGTGNRFGAVLFTGFLKPDVLDYTRNIWMEIKPFSIGGLISGKSQGIVYLLEFGSLGISADRNWVPKEDCKTRGVITGVGTTQDTYYVFNVDGILFYTSALEAAEDRLSVAVGVSLIQNWGRLFGALRKAGAIARTGVSIGQVTASYAGFKAHFAGRLLLTKGF